MKKQRYYSVRYFQVQWEEPGKFEKGVLYIEFDGRFACRQFAQNTNRVIIGGFEFPFLDITGSDEKPNLENVNEIYLDDFQKEWEMFAQPKLNLLASQKNGNIDIHHILMNTTENTANSINEPRTTYFEIINGIVRRQFELVFDKVLVAPYDITFPIFTEGVESLLEKSSSGSDKGDDYTIEVIDHLKFEAAWEHYANLRIRELIRLFL